MASWRSYASRVSQPSPSSTSPDLGRARSSFFRLFTLRPDVRRDLAEVVWLFVALRLALGVLAYLMWFTNKVPGPCHFELALDHWTVFPPIDDKGMGFPLFGMWQRWDACWYTNIAANGYALKDSVSFWPLFPALTSFAGSIVGGDMALGGMIVNSVAYVIAMVGLLQLVRADFGRRVASRTVLFVSVFPAAFFLFAPFTEAVFLACSVWAIYGARRHLWLLAGIAGVLAGFSRIQGVFLVLPIGWEALHFWWRRGLPAPDPDPAGESAGKSAPRRPAYLDAPDLGFGRIRSEVAGFLDRLPSWRPPSALDLVRPAIAVVLPFVAFTIFIQWAGQATGQTPFNAQDAWGGQNYHAPWETLQVAWDWAWQHNSNVELLDVVVLAFFLVAVVVGVFRLPLTYSLFALPQVLLVSMRIQPTPLTSTLRLMLVVFPVFVLMALGCKNRRLERGWVLLSLMLLTYLVSLYLKGDFVA